jgi:hypothetical protein
VSTLNVVMCKPFSTWFRPDFRYPCLVCRRNRLTFALVCSLGGKEVGAIPFESGPTLNVEQKGEKLETWSNWLTFATRHIFHTLVFFFVVNVLKFIPPYRLKSVFQQGRGFQEVLQNRCEHKCQHVKLFKIMSYVKSVYRKC